MYFLLQREKFGFDVAENGPSKVSMFVSFNICDYNYTNYVICDYNYADPKIGSGVGWTSPLDYRITDNCSLRFQNGIS